MAIANFLFLRGSRARFYIIPALILLLANCQSQSVKPHFNEPRVLPPVPAPTPHSAEPAPTPQPTVVPAPPAATPQVGGLVPPIKALPPIELPKNEVPKIGLILGPGGMRTWAHVGALRQMQSARIPIHSIVGMEWGAFIGYLFAQKGQANDAEWQSMKIKDSELPGVGLLYGKVKRRGINVMDDAFKRSLGDAALESAKIEFACPTVQIRGEKTFWQNRGVARGAMTRCVPYPPFFSDNNEYLAAPFAFDEAANWLRSRGAQVVVLIDVLGTGDFFSKSDLESQYIENLLWQEVRRESRGTTLPLINHVISINSSHHSIVDPTARRALIELGQSNSAEVVKQIAKKYGI